ncbi:MAG: tetratricopeptide repeat protein [Planctomycetota bacterium]|jgi:tetratricopeptide (TPR) repeat protein
MTEAGPAGKRTFPARGLFGALIIVAATLVAYLPAMGGGYIWDDDVYVYDNPLLRDASGLARIWTPSATVQYYPAVFTTFWIEYQLWGPHPLGYHVVNVLLHLLNALLVWRVFLRVGVPGAWMIAAVFALHPVHVESVAWITERKNVLSALFYLLAALTYLRFDALSATAGSQRRPGSVLPWSWYAASLGLFALAVLSKTVTVTLPAALVLAMLHLRRPLTRTRLALLLPFVVIGLGFALNTAHVERANVGAVGPEFEFTVAERLLIATRALLFYPFKLLAPTSLTFIYPRWAINAAAPAAYWSVPVVAVVAAAAALASRRGVRGPALALTYYAVTILPALGLVSFYPMRFSFVADHFQYLPSLGVIALVVASAAIALEPTRLAPALAVLALAGLGVFTWYQSRMYKDAETLWTWTARENPEAWIAQNNLGLILLDQGQYALADERFRAALHAKPDLYEAHGNLADSLERRGRLQDAFEQFRIAAEHAQRFEQEILALLHPRRLRASAAYRLRAAGILEKLDRDAEAETWYRSALWTARDHREVRLALAWFLATCSDDTVRSGTEAVALAVRLNDDSGGRDPVVLDTLAAAYAEVGRFDDAIGASSIALDLARALGREDLADQIERRLVAYRAGRTWRDGATKGVGEASRK